MDNQKLEKLAWEEVDSSNINRVAFDPVTKTLIVNFHNGGLYTYFGVDLTIYTALIYAPSVGKFLDRVVKGVNPYMKWNDEAEIISDLNNKRA